MNLFFISNSQNFSIVIQNQFKQEIFKAFMKIISNFEDICSLTSEDYAHIIEGYNKQFHNSGNTHYKGNSTILRYREDLKLKTSQIFS